MGNSESQKTPKPAQANVLKKQEADKSSTSTEANKCEHLALRPETQIVKTREADNISTACKANTHENINLRPQTQILKTREADKSSTTTKVNANKNINLKPQTQILKSQKTDKSSTATKANKYKKLDLQPKTQILTTQKVPKDPTTEVKGLNMTGSPFCNAPTNVDLKTTTEKELKTGQMSLAHSQWLALCNIMPPEHSNPLTKHVQPQMPSKEIVDNGKGNTNEILSIKKDPGSVLPELWTSKHQTGTEKKANVTVLNYTDVSVVCPLSTEDMLESSSVQNEDVCKSVPSHTVNASIGSGWLPNNQSQEVKSTVNNAIGSRWLPRDQNHNTKHVVANTHTAKPTSCQEVKPTVNNATALKGGHRQDKKEMVANRHAANQPYKPTTCEELEPTDNYSSISEWFLRGHTKDKKEVVTNVHAANLLPMPTPCREVKITIDTAPGLELLPGGHRQAKKEVVVNRQATSLPQKPTPCQEVIPTVNTAIDSDWLLGGHRQDKKEVVVNRRATNLPQKPTPCQEVISIVNTASGGYRQDKKEVVGYRIDTNLRHKPTTHHKVKPTFNTVVNKKWLPETQKHNATKVSAKMHTSSLAPKPTPIFLPGSKTSKTDGGPTFISLKSPLVKLKDIKAELTFARPMGTSVTQKIDLTSKQNIQGDHSISKHPPFCKAQSNIATGKPERVTAHFSYADALKKNLQQKPFEQHLDVQPMTKPRAPVVNKNIDLKDKDIDTGKDMPTKQTVKEKTTNVKNAKVRTTEKTFQKSGKEGQEKLPNTCHWEHGKNKGSKNTNLPNLARASKKPNTVRKSPQTNSNEQLQFSDFSGVKQRSSHFVLMRTDEKFAQPQSNLKARCSILSNPQKSSAETPQGERNLSGSQNGQTKVRSQTSLFPDQGKPKKHPVKPVVFLFCNPDGKKKSLKKRTELGQEAPTTIILSSRNAEIKQGLPNSFKALHPAHTEDKTGSNLTQEVIEETNQTHSNAQSQLETNEIPVHHGMQLPGSSPKNGQFCMQVTSYGVQDGSPRPEKYNEDRATDDRPNKKYKDFYVDRGCSMICRCKHHPGKLPSNVIRWLSATENKLSEPAWMTVLHP